MGIVSGSGLLEGNIEELENNVPVVEETAEMIDDTFDDQPIDEAFEEGESLVGEKYDTPKVDEKFVDVRKGTVIDKKDVTPILQIKAFYESNNIKIKDPKSGCRKCYGRGYTGFELKTQTYMPCGCLFPAQTRVKREQEGYRMAVEGKMGNTPEAKRLIRKWKKQTQKKLLHQKVLELFKNKDAVLSASAEYAQQRDHILSASSEAVAQVVEKATEETSNG